MLLPPQIHVTFGGGRAGPARGEVLSRLRLVLSRVTLVSLIGCSSPDHKTEDAARSLHSWEATVRQTISAFDQRAVPRLYARQVLQAAVETKDQHAKQPEWNALPAEARGGLADAIDQLTASLDSGNHSRE